MFEFNCIYYVFVVLAVLSAAFVVISDNPVHSVFFLILTFVLVSCVVLMLNVDFIGIIFIVIYVGAIAVLFLFVVMLLNVRIVEKISSLVQYLPLGVFIGFLLFYELYSVISKTGAPVAELGGFIEGYFIFPKYVDFKATLYLFGDVLYTHFIYEFILSGLILLVAMIGTIVLTLNHKIDVKRQEIYKQVGRDINLRLYSNR